VRAQEVIDMPRSASLSLLGSEFDEFLFAPIGEDGNGMRVSVLSALARLDIDPWQEAARLARLPGKAAAERLASLIEALPDRPQVQRHAGTIAADLVALLPRRMVPDLRASRKPLRWNPPRWNPPGAAALANSRAFLYAVIVALALTTLTMMSGRQRPMTVDDSRAPVTATRVVSGGDAVNAALTAPPARRPR
jgi:hypothetical protein